ncbi:hypothetical protein HYH03_003134 [Edaphochlamys debaryana]|uniref:Complex 1 LYR protein domain-containing protein n=1 Tax=Edaphochlamys debaryana TaxID=47281 RepID=A0A835YC14_9CHLO|nr:hypothetical protein HYH03_003134 [Edaphochlamys debaryana]|eukprot:KAG2498944.1 hypothetical protein HYH03_003134 [Edaphochlamys debaryana]
MSTGTKLHVLSLFRAFLREARQMPTAARREHIRKKVRSELEAHRAEGDPDKVAFLVQLAEVQLENATLQRVHLNELASKGQLKC